MEPVTSATDTVIEKDYVSNHAPKLLIKLDSDRKSSAKLCDVIVQVGKRNFLLHKCVLAIFTGLDDQKWMSSQQTDKKGRSVVHVHGVSPKVMEKVFDFIYLCKITITTDNAFELFDASEKLEIPELKQHCVLFLMESVSAHNCLSIRDFANKHKLEQLSEKAEKIFLIENFDMVLSQDQFKELPLENVISLLKLNVKHKSEDETIFKAVIGWVAFDSPNRTDKLDELFEHVDLGNLSNDFLQNIVAEEELVLKNPLCLRKLLQAIASRCFAETDKETSLKDQEKAPENANFPVASLYVGDLHASVTEEMIHDEISSVGDIVSIHLCRDEETDKSRGFGFIVLEDIANAKEVLEELNHTPINRHPMHLVWSQYDPSLAKSGFGCIFVKNLPKSFNNQALYGFFSIFGDILSCRVRPVKADGSTRQGFIHFETDEAAKHAISTADGLMVGGNEISVGAYLTSAERHQFKEDRKEQFRNLFIKNFANKLSEEDLTKMFEVYGELGNVSIQRDDKGHSLGFGFVSFIQHEDAQNATKALNGTTIKGTKLKLFVGPAKTKKEREEELEDQEELQSKRTNLYVKQFDETMTDEDLLNLFSSFGEITSAKVMRDAKGKSKKFGFVCFKSEEAATNAQMAMNGKKIKSKRPRLYVSFHEKKENKANQQPGPSAPPQNPPMMIMRPLVLIPPAKFGVAFPPGPPVGLLPGISGFGMRPLNLPTFNNGPKPLPTEAELASMGPQDRKQELRSLLYPIAAKFYMSSVAVQIAEKLLEEDNSVILKLLRDEDSFKQKADVIAEEIKASIPQMSSQEE